MKVKIEVGVMLEKLKGVCVLNCKEGRKKKMMMM
jgi:hypothetical protein